MKTFVLGCPCHASCYGRMALCTAGRKPLALNDKQRLACNCSISRAASVTPSLQLTSPLTGRRFRVNRSAGRKV